MERVKALLAHAHEYRNLAFTFTDPKMKQELKALADQCERIAADMAKNDARKEGSIDTRHEQRV